MPMICAGAAAKANTPLQCLNHTSRPRLCACASARWCSRKCRSTQRSSPYLSADANGPLALARSRSRRRRAWQRSVPGSTAALLPRTEATASRCRQTARARRLAWPVALDRRHSGTERAPRRSPPPGKSPSCCVSRRVGSRRRPRSGRRAR
eukprot:scaffold79188_cov63-Phaeocystis_antarctica.AAC.3